VKSANTNSHKRTLGHEIYIQSIVKSPEANLIIHLPRPQHLDENKAGKAEGRSKEPATGNLAELRSTR
jgi:hypothetical protein